MKIQGEQVLYPYAPCGVQPGDTVVFMAHRHWYDFLLPSRRYRPLKLGEAKVKMVDPVARAVWFEHVPSGVLPGDYMFIEESGRFHGRA